MLDVADGGEAVRHRLRCRLAHALLAMAARWTSYYSSSARSIPARLTTRRIKILLRQRKAYKYCVRVYDRFPIRNGNKRIEDTQAHVFVQTDVTRLEGGKYHFSREPTPSRSRGFAGRVSDSGEELDSVWTPEGDAIVFVASTNRTCWWLSKTQTHRCSKFRGKAVANRCVSRLGDNSFTNPVV